MQNKETCDYCGGKEIVPTECMGQLAWTNCPYCVKGENLGCNKKKGN